MPYLLNVPSNLLEFKDGGLSFRNGSETAKTKSVLVLGFGQDGPLDPVAVDADTVDKVFGKDVDENGNKTSKTITTYVNDLHRAGCNDIRAMKICGSTAKTSISTEAKEKTTVEKKAESLGIIEGNDETTLTISQTDAIEDSIRIYINDNILSSTFEFKKDAKQIVIPANVAEAGATVMIKYDYMKTVPKKKIAESLTLDNTLAVNLTNTPDNNSIVAKLNGVVITTDRYDVANKKVTFKNEGSKKPVFAENNIVVIEYTASVKEKAQMTDAQNNGQRYITAFSLQELTLAETPKLGSFHLYCNDAEVAKSLYVVDGKKVKVRKEKLPKDRALECSYFVEKKENVTSVVDFESFFASSVYNLGSVEVVELKNKDNKTIGKTILIHKPESKKAPGELPLSYTSLQYPTFEELVDAINLDLRNGVYKTSTDFGGELTSSLKVGISQFTGGDSGMNATTEEIKEYLSGVRDEEGYLLKEGVYQLLQNYTVDYVVLTGIYADDELSGRDTFDYDLSQFCAIVSNTNHVTYGIIATKPCENHSLAGIKQYVEKLSRFNADGRRFLRKDNGKVFLNPATNKPVDMGAYVRVVGGPEPIFFSETLGNHPTNPAIAYAGLQSALRPQSSPMNKSVPNSLGIKYKLADSYLQALTSANIITFFAKSDRSGNVRPEAFVFDSMTCALPSSDYVRTTTCEIAKTIGDDVREVADPYIGEPPTQESRNSFAAALDKRFSERRTEGVAEKVGFEIKETAVMKAIGDCLVEVSIQVPGERRRITTVIGLKAPGSR